MSANTVPRYTESVVLGMAQISTANTNRDGTGTLGTVHTAGEHGSRIDLIRVVGTGTTTAGVVRIFVDDGSNVRLLKEILVDAITPSTSIEVFTDEYQPTEPLLMPATWILKASTHNAEAFNVFAIGGDY